MFKLSRWYWCTRQSVRVGLSADGRVRLKQRAPRVVFCYVQSKSQTQRVKEDANGAVTVRYPEHDRVACSETPFVSSVPRNEND